MIVSRVHHTINIIILRNSLSYTVKAGLMFCGLSILFLQAILVRTVCPDWITFQAYSSSLVWFFLVKMCLSKITTPLQYHIYVPEPWYFLPLLQKKTLFISLILCWKENLKNPFFCSLINRPFVNHTRTVSKVILSLSILFLWKPLENVRDKKVWGSIQDIW